MGGSAVNPSAGLIRPASTSQRRSEALTDPDVSESRFLAIAGVGMSRVAYWGALEVTNAGTFTSAEVSLYVDRLGPGVSGKGAGDLVMTTSLVPGPSAPFYENFPTLIGAYYYLAIDIVGLTENATITTNLCAAQ